jgi:hypothetical protein
VPVITVNFDDAQRCIASASIVREDGTMHLLDKQAIYHIAKAIGMNTRELASGNEDMTLSAADAHDALSRGGVSSEDITVLSKESASKVMDEYIRSIYEAVVHDNPAGKTAAHVVESINKRGIRLDHKQNGPHLMLCVSTVDELLTEKMVTVDKQSGSAPKRTQRARGKARKR